MLPGIVASAAGNRGLSAAHLEREAPWEGPLVGVHEHYGLIETAPGCYVKSYAVGPVNYQTAPEEEQLVVYGGWKRLLNSFGSNMEAALTVYCHSVNVEEFTESVRFKEMGDGHDALRRELNEVMTERMQEGKNGMQRDVYLTLAVHTDSAKSAWQVFGRLDKDVDKTLRRIGSSARPLSVVERLELLYGIYNDPKEHLQQAVRTRDGDGKIREDTSFSFARMRQLGLTAVDMVAPDSIRFLGDCMQLGGKYARTLSVSQMANKMDDTFFMAVTETEFNSITTVNFRALPVKTAESLVARNLSFIRDEKTRQLRAGQKQGVYDDSYVNPELLDREAEALALRDAIRSRDERLFDTAMTAVVFAKSPEELEEYTESLCTEYKKRSFTLSAMRKLQEEGFCAALPLCVRGLKAGRTLTGSSLAMFVPFDTVELMDPGGINYSCNLISKNPIFYDRLNGINYNAFILGCPGTGKSMTAKYELLWRYLRSNDTFFVIDPENEYGTLAQELGGQVVDISPSSRNHINPMAVDAGDMQEDGADPVSTKSDFILKLLSAALKTLGGLTSVYETVIDECVRGLFEPFAVHGRLRGIPQEEMPTLTDLMLALSDRREPEARELAKGLGLYTTGSLNIFGHPSNVDLHARLVVFQIRDIGEELKPMAMMVILELILNTIVRNRRRGIYTWYTVDEISLLFQNRYAANLLNSMVARNRKYGAVFTGVSQNVTPILENAVARDMLQNCSFIQILGLAGPDRENLRHLLNLSGANVEYITNSPSGQGIIYTGRNVIPFYGEIPKDKRIYRLITSNPRELYAYEAKEREEALTRKTGVEAG